MLVNKFIYDLFGRPKPTEAELEEEIDRLLYVRTTEEPNFLVRPEELDSAAHFDQDIVDRWIQKKFRPAFLLLYLLNSDNYWRARGELGKMQRYETIVDKIIRPKFVHYQASQRLRETLFMYDKVPELPRIINDLRRTLTFLSEHLKSTKNTTLMDTIAYTNADITLYRYLKRIMIGKYNVYGLKNHIKLCDPLILFMQRFATKNTNIIDVSAGDPLLDEDTKESLLADMVKPAAVALGFILFHLWCTREQVQ